MDYSNFYNYHDYDYYEIKKNIKTLNNFRNTYYYLKFKQRFRDLLWIKVREPKIQNAMQIGRAHV